MLDVFMTRETHPTAPMAGIGFFERYLTLWVLLCIVAGIALGRPAPDRGMLFLPFIGPAAVDHVTMPLGVNLAVGKTYEAGTVVLHQGVKMLAVPLWRSYLAGCILIGIAPCTAMVLVWGHLARGNAGHALVMVAVNSLTMLVL